MESGNGRRLVLAISIHEYGARTERMRAQMQEGLAGVLDQAAARTRLDRSSWSRQRSDDGELAVLPPSEPEPRVTDQFVRQLDAALREYNRLVADEAKLRLRLAIHFGPANKGPYGFVGSGPLVAKRLCDCPAAERALTGSGAELVVIVSAQVFEDTIAEQLTSLEQGDLRKVGVGGRTARIWAPGHRLEDLDLEPAPAKDQKQTSQRPREPSDSTEDRRPTTSGSFPGAPIEVHGDGYIAGRDMYFHRGEK